MSRQRSNAELDEVRLCGRCPDFEHASAAVPNAQIAIWNICPTLDSTPRFFRFFSSSRLSVLFAAGKGEALGYRTVSQSTVLRKVVASRMPRVAPC